MKKKSNNEKVVKGRGEEKGEAISHTGGLFLCEE